MDRKVRGFAEPQRGNRFRVTGSICLLVLSLFLMGPSATRAQEGDDSTQSISPEEWSVLLREHADDFAAARLAQHQARLAGTEGDKEEARRLYEKAADLDRRYEQPHFERAWLDLRSGRTTVAGELYDGFLDQFSGFRNQSRAVANALLILDLVLAATGVWILCALLIRYLPFAWHQLASRFDPENHLRPSARRLWMVVAAPFLLGWGLVPFVTLAFPVVWVYADRRVRTLLALGMAFFVVQGVWTRPFATALVGTDPTSTPALVERAAYEPPTGALLRDVRMRLQEAPSDPDLLLAQGMVLARRGEFTASSRSFLANLQARPNDAASTNNLASNHFFLGDIDRAVAGFQRSAALDSTQAVPYYNLSQAYIQKLYFKEGGEAMQQAMRRGFVVTQQVEQLPRGAVYFVRPGAVHLWKLAWQGAESVGPFDLLDRYSRWLGVPAAHAGYWLAVTLALALGLGMSVARHKLVFECVNCGQLVCRRCQGDHEGAILCSGCVNTARRAKSELVLQTLLRNRRRDAETAYQRRLRRWDLLFSAGRIVDGMRPKGIVVALLVSSLGVALVLGGAPLRDVWEGHAGAFWSFPRCVGAAGLGLLLLFSLIFRGGGRGRHVQPHPSSSVSLVGLIEGRAQTKLKSGGRA